MCQAGVGETFENCIADCAKILETTWVEGNGAGGNFFTVTALKDITITQFDIHTTNVGTGTVTIWERAGSYIGVESNRAAWNRIMIENNIQCQGVGQQTSLPRLTRPLSLEAGETRSFHIASSQGISYTNGVSESAVFAENAELRLFEGKGSADEFSPSTFTPRVWNGHIHYALGIDGGGPETTNTPTSTPTKVRSYSLNVLSLC